MTTDTTLYDYVMAQLLAKRIPREVVAAKSGVPYSTVNKIAQKRIKDPSVHTIQRLADYFQGRAVNEDPPEQGQADRRQSAFAKPAALRSTERPRRRRADAGERSKPEVRQIDLAFTSEPVTPGIARPDRRKGEV